MTARERLLSLSSLTICASAIEHFCSITQTGGGGDTIINVVGLYDVEYIGEENNIIEYLDTPEIIVEYVAHEQVEIEYIGEENNIIEYVPNEIIEIEFICQ